MIQCTGSYTGEFDYSLSICYDNYAVTLDGLSKEDMQELQSCINCMLLEDNE